MIHMKDSAPFWHLLHKIDSALDQVQPLKKRLKNVSEVLVNTLDFQAIWCITLPPLPNMCYGTVKTPLSVDKNAAVSIFDQQGSNASVDAESATLLEQIFADKIPWFSSSQRPSIPHLDLDMGDTLFTSFDTVPVAAIPLIAGDMVWGGIIFGQRQATNQEIDADTQHLLEYLAKYLGRILQHIYLQHNAAHYADTMRTLNDIAHTITSSLEIDDVIQQTMAGINTVLNVEAGSLLLLDETTKELYFKITLRGENKQITSYRLKPGEGVAGWVATNNRSTIVNDPVNDTRFTNKIDRAIGFKTSSLLCVPLVVQGQPIGALEVVNKRHGDFVIADQELLQAMSASLGVALSNVMLYDRAQDRIRQNEVINRVTAAISAGRGLSATANSIFTELSNLIDFNHLIFSLADKVSGSVRQWVFGEYGSLEQRQLITSLESSRLAELLAQGQAFIENDLSEREQRPDDRIFINEDTKSLLGVMLKTEAEPFGCLTLGHSRSHSFKLKDLNLLEQLGPHLSVVIEKALLLDDMEKRTQELHLLNRLIEMLVSTTDFKEIIKTIISTTPRLLPNEVHGVLITSETGAHLGLAIPFDFQHTEEMEARLMQTLADFRTEETLPTVTSTRIIAGNLPVPNDWQPVADIGLPIITRQGTIDSSTRPPANKNG